jgi:hypothetical protein
MEGTPAVWAVLAAFIFVPFIGLGVAVRPIWLAMVIPFGISLVWIPGLGVGAFLVSGTAGALGALLGYYLRGVATRYRARRLEARQAPEVQEGR